MTLFWPIALIWTALSSLTCVELKAWTIPLPALPSWATVSPLIWVAFRA